MTYAEIEQARKAAAETIRIINSEVGAMVRMCAGNLRKADGYGTWCALAKLKAELRDFDSRKRAWK